MNPILQADLAHIIGKMKPIAEGLRGKSILIAGGTGFIGRWMVESLDYLNAALDLGVSFKAIRRNNMLDGFRRFDYVIHAAKDTLETTAELVEYANACGASKFLYVSSGAVEHCKGEYARIKREGELSAFRGDFLIACVFTLVGPFMPLDGQFAVGNFIRDALAGGPIRVRGDGNSIRSYLYAADLAIWLWTILLKGRDRVPYDVGSDIEVSTRQLAHEVAGPHSVMIDGFEKSSRYVPANLERTKKELGLDVWIGRQEAIRRTMEYYRHEMA